MGLSSKKSKTTTNQNTTATIAPTNPTFTTDAVGGLAGRVEDTFKGLDPYSLVPGADPLQTQAGTAAAGLTTSPNFGQASDTLRDVAAAGPSSYAPAQAKASSLLENLGDYMSPYTNDVVNTTLAGFDQNAGRTRAQQQLDIAGDTTFGGSGGSILRSLTEGELARGRASTEAGLRDQAFTTGAGLSSHDADARNAVSLANMQAANDAGRFNATAQETALSRQAGAATSLADVGTAQGADARSNIGTQAGIGDILRQIAAAKAGAPITSLGANADILGKIPFDLLKGSNATGSLDGTSTSKSSGAGLGDWLNFFAANAASAAKSGAGA